MKAQGIMWGQPPSAVLRSKAPQVSDLINAMPTLCILGAAFLASFLVLTSSCLAAAQKVKEDAYSPGKKDVYAELAKAPAKAARRRNPLERDPDAAAAGAKLFDQHCAECHGEMGEGTHKGPSLRVGEVRQAAPGTLFWILTNGVVRRGMPVWSKLPEPQRWQLVSYLKSLSPTKKSAPLAPSPSCDFPRAPGIKQQ